MDDYIRALTEKCAERTAHYEELTALTEAPEIIADNRLWRQYVMEKTAVERAVSLCNELKIACDLDLTEDITAIAEELTIELLDKNELERGNVLIELTAPDEASERLATDIIKIYSSYAKKEGFAFSVLDEDSTKAGIKSCTASVNGVGAYLKFRGETGLHRSSDGGTVTVTAIPSTLYNGVTLDPKDIRTDVFHATGAGGQNINKVATAIRLTHIPTGIVAVCRDERSQLRNRERAKEALMAKVTAYYREKEEAKRLKLKRESTAEAKQKRIRLYDRKRDAVTDVRTNVSVPFKSALNGDIAKIINSVILHN